LLSNDERGLSDCSATNDGDSVTATNVPASNAMDGNGKWLNQAPVGCCDSDRKSGNRRNRNENLLGHSSVASNAERHRWSADAELRVSVDAGIAHVAGINRFNCDRGAVGESAGELVSKRGRKAEAQEVKVGTTNSGRRHRDKNSVASRFRNIDNGGYSFWTTNCAHGSPWGVRWAGAVALD